MPCRRPPGCTQHLSHNTTPDTCSCVRPMLSETSLVNTSTCDSGLPLHPCDSYNLHRTGLTGSCQLERPLVIDTLLDVVHQSAGYTGCVYGNMCSTPHLRPQMAGLALWQGPARSVSRKGKHPSRVAFFHRQPGTGLQSLVVLPDLEGKSSLQGRLFPQAARHRPAGSG